MWSHGEYARAPGAVHMGRKRGRNWHGAVAVPGQAVPPLHTIGQRYAEGFGTGIVENLLNLI